MLGDEDLLPVLREVTNPAYDLTALEFSIGTNEISGEEGIDWAVNSQLNEGTRGIHIGLGEGVSAAHIDFIATEVRASFAV
jgi:hypothetical protein